ncbi:MAG: hypothetical protein A2552_05820 [Sulfuricurvum sp. RIFOXYD2_FULL_44_160]|uniref:Uncharacterized protein n=1 Tax=Sulfuricurvum kujiense TaxID=148813 RepID=A0A2D3WKG9_9BACT|nr:MULTISPECIES: hypothetical protein [Sulfuricurvum]OHD92659.1 MAG: hypothetical protein A2517_05100 [Sulfuricurvum sp. RIFOXYD12_FULL_44_77]OHD93769.1 MAG: hypothetical protein A2552_05820 [Sulfuricurvum sp. RIFOXYD2_FULL_44_160]DAB38214.1 MAG TPA: hypothetical protein CFH83_07090 [Sulfuricurvum kujiense]
MELRYSEYFGIDKTIFEKLGIFNGFILHDSEYYLNPKLIKNTDNTFFESSYQKIQKRFALIISTVEKIQIPDKKDYYYKSAIDAIKSKENGYIGLGYSEAGKKGRGIGTGLAESIVLTAYKLIKQDKVEPELFEILGVFKEQISVDRISDMIIKIIEDDILKYTQYIAKELKLSVKLYKNHLVPFNHFDNNSPLYFLPTSLLSKLPIWDELYCELVDESTEARDLFNSTFGEAYKHSEVNKKEKEVIFTKNKFLVDKVIELYKKTNEEAYDFISDPSNDFKWIDLVKNIVIHHPLILQQDQPIYDIVKMICNKFQDLVENTNAYKLFYDDNKHIKHERASQQAFQLFASSYCNANNLDISPESNGGRGPVDFKFSKGKEKVLVELKLSSAQITTLTHCLETQIKIYEKSEDTKESILLILLVGTSAISAEKKIEDLIKYKNNSLKNAKYLPEVIAVDALIKPSASKA